MTGQFPGEFMQADVLPEQAENAAPSSERATKNTAQAMDPWLLFAALALTGIGLVMVYSSSGWHAHAHAKAWEFYFRRQAAFAGIGCAAMLVLSRLDYRIARRLAGEGMLLSLAALALVRLIGSASHGAKRWLGVGSFGVQPSEIAKLALVVFLAATLAKKGEAVRAFKTGYAPALLATFGMVAMVATGKDFGNSLLMTCVAMIMLFVAGTRLSYILLTILLGLPVLWSSIVFVDYRVERFRTFFSGEDYQVQQSLIAIGSGGPFGLGLGAGRQKLGFLPENHTDFIFASVGEELGAVGMCVVIGLYALLAWRGIQCMRDAPDRFGSYLALGITSLLSIQALINMAVVLKVVPAKGITLPMVSFGGSSMVASLIAVGILLSISRRPAPSRLGDLRHRFEWPGTAWLQRLQNKRQQRESVAASKARKNRRV